MIRIEGSYRSSSGNWSTIGYSTASNLPLFSGDSISTVVIAGASLDVATSTVISMRATFALRDFISRYMIDDSINLVMGRLLGGFPRDTTDTFIIRRDPVLQTKGVSSEPSTCLVSQLKQ
jgi:hypothetical protein